MPRYTYQCEFCDIKIIVVHSMKERLSDCEECGKTNILKRIPSILNIKKQTTGNSGKPGEKVKAFIEETRAEVKKEKQNMKKEKKTK